MNTRLNDSIKSGTHRPLNATYVRDNLVPYTHEAPKGKTAAMGIVAQEVMQLPPGILPKEKDTLLILPLADFQRAARAHPEGRSTLDKYGVSEETFVNHLINGYNELADIETRETLLETLLVNAGVGSLSWDEMVEDREALDDLSQTFAISMDRHLLTQGMSVTHSSHQLHAIRQVGPDAVMVSISPIESD